jgi:hypothetical protein
LTDVPGGEGLREALSGFGVNAAALHLHRQPTYAPTDPEHRSFLNVRAAGPYSEGSMSMAHVMPTLVDGTPIDLWKSWSTFRAEAPGEPLAETTYRHMIPTVDTLAAQAALAGQQGLDGLFVLGGYTRPYDSQETALLSALAAAEALAPEAPNVALLRAWRAAVES